MSEARNTAGCAMSSGVPIRPIGMRPVKLAVYSAFCRASALSGVAVKPGPIALTRMPIGPSSIASALVSSRTPPSPTKNPLPHPRERAPLRPALRLLLHPQGAALGDGRRLARLQRVGDPAARADRVRQRPDPFV